MPSVVGTIGTSLRENEAFLYFASLFGDAGLPVPSVLAVSADRMSYLQSVAGNRSLYDRIVSHGADSDEVVRLAVEAVRLLPGFQFVAQGAIDQSKCYPRGAMDARAIMWDLNYFKYCFLKPSGIEFDEDRLEDDFSYLAQVSSENPEQTLILRDFQSRNILLDDDDALRVIDFQGARLGDCVYDVASFVEQSRAGFSPEHKARLMDEYCRAVESLTGNKPVDFQKRYAVMALLRVLQTLGAYGFRGLIERKALFITAIPKAVGNLRELLDRFDYSAMPYLEEVLRRMAALKQFQPHEEADSLTVRVMSFSYKKGIPVDESGNGGGFVFDCRALHNPGRYERFRSLTGRDRDVVEFLEQRGEVQPFLDSAYRLVDRSVETYLRRGFTSLMVCFGCTGGQHRSVYGAECMARHLSEKFGVRIRLEHREQSIDQIIPAK